jgi:hypothetical protein
MFVNKKDFLLHILIGIKMIRAQKTHKSFPARKKNFELKAP